MLGRQLTGARFIVPSPATEYVAQLAMHGVGGGRCMAAPEGEVNYTDLGANWQPGREAKSAQRGEDVPLPDVHRHGLPIRR